MSKYYKAEDVIRRVAEYISIDYPTEERAREDAELLFVDLPTIEVSEGNQVLYGTGHNCILTLFGECSYNETGCGSCAVAEKIRKALEVSEDCINGYKDGQRDMLVFLLEGMKNALEKARNERIEE